MSSQMKTNMMRILSLVLVLLMALTVFAACKKGEDTTDSKSSVPADTTTDAEIDAVIDQLEEQIKEDTILDATEEDPFTIAESDIVLMVNDEETGTRVLEIAEKTTLETVLTIVAAKEGFELKVVDADGEEITDMEEEVADGMALQFFSLEISETATEEERNTPVASLTIKVLTVEEIEETLEEQEQIEQQNEQIQQQIQQQEQQKPSNKPSGGTTTPGTTTPGTPGTPGTTTPGTTTPGTTPGTTTGDTEALKDALDMKGQSITVMRDWGPYASGKNAAHTNFNNWVNKTEKRFNVKIVEKAWKATLAGEMLAGVKPEGHLYLIGYNSGGNVIDLATKGYLATLDDAMKETGITMNEEIYNEYNVQHGNINGHQYSIGVGFARINATILYNKKLTAAAGYDIAQLVKDKKWTWDKMTEVGKKTTIKNNSGEVTQWGIGMGHAGIKALVMSNGGKFIYPDSTGKFVSKVNSQNTIEALQKAYEWYNVDGIANSFSGGQWTDGNKAFAEKKVALYFSGHAGATSAYSSLSGDDYGVAYLPMGPRMKKYVAYMVREYAYVIPAAYQDMTTELLLIADEMHQWPVKDYTRDDEFRDEWTRYFHTSEQYRMWWNHHFSDEVERVWEGMDLMPLSGESTLDLGTIIKGTKTAAAWADANHSAYNTLISTTGKNVRYTGKLK